MVMVLIQRFIIHLCLALFVKSHSCPWPLKRPKNENYVAFLYEFNIKHSNINSCDADRALELLSYQLLSPKHFKAGARARDVIL